MRAAAPPDQELTMPAFVVYELAPTGVEQPYAFVPEASDALDALRCLHLPDAAFVARDSHRSDTGDVLLAQYRMNVRDVASRRPRRRF